MGHFRGIQGSAEMITKRNLLIGCALAPILYEGEALACDDPPQHYKKPCKTAYSRYSAYVPIALAQKMFEKNKVTTTSTLIDKIGSVMEDPDLGVACLRGSEMVEALLQGIRLTVIATPVVEATVELWVRSGGPKNLKDLKSGTT